jgi:predicted nucleic acid-binding Zn ribbon protein
VSHPVKINVAMPDIASARRAGTSPLKEVIDQMLNVYQLKGKYTETYLVDSWSRIMGPAIARRTSKIYVKDRKLFIKINSAPLKNELAMSKSKILEILNREVKEALLEEVVFL